MAASSAFSADAPGVLGRLRQVAHDDQEEWEYEYSATETETYYLTLELSYPEFKDRATRGPHHSRGGYYKNCMDHSMAFLRTTVASDDENDDDGDPEADDGVGDGDGDGDGDGGGDDDGLPVDPELLTASKRMETERRAAKKGKEAAQEKEQDDQEEDDEAEALDDIQILDLHSPNPIISYRGRVFEGQWAEVIGTEAIFARHNKSQPLPALRNLADKVDVLAASSSRIMTTEKVLEPKVAEQDTLAPIKEEWNIRVPSGKDRTGERALQANFLENLMALKKKKGQTDQVTVYAADGVGKDWDDRYGPDYKRRAKKRPGRADEDGDGDGGETRRGRGRRARGHRRARAGARARGRNTGASHEGRFELSLPTPDTWEELSGKKDGGDEPDESEGVEAEDVSMTGYD
ncbi:Transcription factor TFIIIC, tau55-related protein [Ophiocordyceps sinensis CO18]|uniref:Transcription factor TFIIIC, tau55-related protein n=1 Tax=Ophiocordyceps sinensis (strain Co18 / CGMCC 3.14243) TaxID=911162 RepID=T5A8G1_OPHSC|nr:Transcription factor TFIIIC, tau55-related protein [Ophiocordyceps sinensis CO18]